MADNGSDSMCCSASNPVDDSSHEFQIGHWNSDAVDGVNEPNDLHIGVFHQDDASTSYMDRAVRLEFPKLSKDLEASDFSEFLRVDVGEENVERLANWNQPNIWIMELKNSETREKLLRMWKTKIKDMVCWIIPYHDYELRGYLHWVPHFVSDDDVKTQLRQFGEVILLENEAHASWNGKIKNDLRYFGLRLKDGMVKKDMPHFLKFDGYRTLVMIRGRKPACFHCKEFGHSKKNCEKYKEKLDEYCKNPEASRPRTKPRGKRHEKGGKDKKQQDKTNPNPTSTNLAQQDIRNIKSCLKHCGIGKQRVDKKQEEMVVILRSINDWKGGVTEMVEQTLLETENNLRMIFSTPPGKTETEKESFTFSIKTLLEEMRQITITMIEQTLNNLKSIMAQHFGLDSNEELEKLISDFETTKNKKSGPKKVKFVEKKLVS